MNGDHLTNVRTVLRRKSRHPLDTIGFVVLDTIGFVVLDTIGFVVLSFLRLSVRTASITTRMVHTDAGTRRPCLLTSSSLPVFIGIAMPAYPCL